MADIITNFITPPKNLINQELEGIYGKAVLADMTANIKLYDAYENGTKFSSDNINFSPAMLRYKLAKSLIDKQARFMFSKPLDIKVLAESGTDVSKIQQVIDSVLEKSKFHHKLLQASKDCFIAKRVACFLNFDNEGVGIRFAPSLEFVYDTDENNPDKLKKITAFYTINDAPNRGEQRIYRKRYWMSDGHCYVDEGIYNGAGELVEEKLAETKTALPFIPAVVIINDGLTGDLLGSSDIEDVIQYEEYYSKLSNSDMDAERANMYPVKYMRDINPLTSSNLSNAPGAIWDVSTDPSAPEGINGEIGQLEATMNYSSALDITLKRIKAVMHEQLDVPDVANMQQKLSSGKELETVYWGLMVRCDEKFIVWREALRELMNFIIAGLKLYPESRKVYISEEIPDIEYSLDIENQYPLPGDEEKEKNIDLAEIGNKSRSIKSYLKKWRGMTDNEADAELEQIAKERQLLEDSFFSDLMNGGEGGEE